MSEINDILEKIQSGDLSPEEAVSLIEKLKKENSEVSSQKSTMDILKEIETGELSTSEGISMINTQKPIEILPEETFQAEMPTPEEIQNIEKWWRIPWMVGLVLFIGSGLGMNSIVQASQGVNFWFFLLILPLLLGIMILFLTWPSENKPWIHIIIKDSNSKKTKVKISIPLPMKFTSWMFKFGKSFMPLHISEKIDANSIELIFSEIAEGKRTGNPFHIHVDDEDEDIVDIYIG